MGPSAFVYKAGDRESVHDGRPTRLLSCLAVRRRSSTAFRTERARHRETVVIWPACCSVGSVPQRGAERSSTDRRCDRRSQIVVARRSACRAAGCTSRVDGAGLRLEGGRDEGGADTQLTVLAGPVRQVHAHPPLGSTNRSVSLHGPYFIGCRSSTRPARRHRGRRHRSPRR